MRYDGAHWEAPALIAVLSAEDGSNWSGDSTGYTDLAARVSPNGQWLAFMSTQRLTGYDNQDAVSGEPDAEVYEYDAATGSLVCASCNPTGARPHGQPAEQIDTSKGGIAGGHGVFSSNLWISANLPPWTPSLKTSIAIYQSRYLSDSGRLFFNSDDALVSKDIDGTEDVYEYEPEGVPGGEHACSPTSESGGVTFKPARGLEAQGVEVHEGAGCVGLISSGESPRESAFLDAAETGSEVFFVTTSKLVGEDTDSSYDVYVARECTTVSPCAPARPTEPPSCITEASCRPAPSPQPEIFGATGSETFSGPGNIVSPASPVVGIRSKAKPLTRGQLLSRALRSCRKRRSGRIRLACERAARRRFGAHKAARVTRSRRFSGQGGRADAQDCCDFLCCVCACLGRWWCVLGYGDGNACAMVSSDFRFSSWEFERQER